MRVDNITYAPQTVADYTIMLILMSLRRVKRIERKFACRDFSFDGVYGRNLEGRTVGVIGCGAIGKDHCRRIIETVPGATVVAVSDYVAAAADETAAKYGIKSYGNDCDGMIKDPEVEAVVITSIDPTHHTTS